MKEIIVCLFVCFLGFIFFVVFVYIFFLFFPSVEGAWAWLKTHNINHTTTLDKTLTNITPYTCTQSPINAQATKKSYQHPSTPLSP